MVNSNLLRLTFLSSPILLLISIILFFIFNFREIKHINQYSDNSVCYFYESYLNSEYLFNKICDKCSEAHKDDWNCQTVQESILNTNPDILKLYPTTCNNGYFSCFLETTQIQACYISPYIQYYVKFTGYSINADVLYNISIKEDYSSYYQATSRLREIQLHENVTCFSNKNDPYDVVLLLNFIVKNWIITSIFTLLFFISLSSLIYQICYEEHQNSAYTNSAYTDVGYFTRYHKTWLLILFIWLVFIPSVFILPFVFSNIITYHEKIIILSVSLTLICGYVIGFGSFYLYRAKKCSSCYHKIQFWIEESQNQNSQSENQFRRNEDSENLNISPPPPRYSVLYKDIV